MNDLQTQLNDTPKTSEAAGHPSKDWEATAERLFACSSDLERQLTAALADKAALEALVVRKDEALRNALPCIKAFESSEGDRPVELIREVEAALAETPAGLSDKLKATNVLVLGHPATREWCAAVDGHHAATEQILKATEALCAELRDVLGQVMRPHGIYDQAVATAGKAFADEYMATGDAIRAIFAKTPETMGAALDEARKVNAGHIALIDSQGAELARLREALDPVNWEKMRQRAADADTLRQQLAEREKELKLRKDAHAQLVEVLPDGDCSAAHVQVNALRARVAELEESSRIYDRLRMEAIESAQKSATKARQVETQRDALIAAIKVTLNDPEAAKLDKPTVAQLRSALYEANPVSDDVPNEHPAHLGFAYSMYPDGLDWQGVFKNREEAVEKCRSEDWGGKGWVSAVRSITELDDEYGDDELAFLCYGPINPVAAKGAPIEAKPALQAEVAAILELIALHAAQLVTNHYAYFELAYTRQTGWMAWVCDKPCNATTGKPEPDRKIIAAGSGETPHEACRNALNIAARKEAAK